MVYGNKKFQNIELRSISIGQIKIKLKNLGFGSHQKYLVYEKSRFILIRLNIDPTASKRVQMNFISVSVLMISIE